MDNKDKAESVTRAEIITKTGSGFSIKDSVSLQKIIRQHNGLTQARYSLTALEQNIFLLLLSKVKEEDPDYHTYRIDGKDIFFNQTKRSASANLALLKESTSKLLKRIITIKSDKGNDVITHFVSSCEYLDGLGSIEVSFDPKLKPYLIRVKSNYTQFPLLGVLSFKGKYTKRLYQLISQYHDTGMLYLEISDLVDMLQLSADDDGRGKSTAGKSSKKWWELYGSIKQRVLTPAMEEINDPQGKSNFYIYSIKEKKEKRKVVAITILFRKRTTTDAQTINPVIRQKLEKLRLSESQILKISASLSEPEILKICYEIQVQMTSSNVSNVGGYSYSVFKSKIDG